MLYNSPRNDQRSAKTSQTSLTDLSLAIGTVYESKHTFLSSHEKSLIRDFRIFVIIILFFSKRPSASKEGVKPLIFIPNRSTMVRGVHRPQAIVLFHSHVSSENLWSLHESTMNDAILNSVPRLLRPRARVYESLD